MACRFAFGGPLRVVLPPTVQVRRGIAAGGGSVPALVDRVDPNAI